MALLPRSRLHLVVDIGTALISGMIWREYTSAFARNKKPDILEVVRVPITGNKPHALIPVLRLFFQNAHDALGGRDPATIMIGLAAPYYQGKTVWAHTSFALPKAISSAMVKKLCNEQWKTEEQALGKEEELCGHDILAIFLNGYPIGKDPEGKAARELDVAIRFSIWRSAFKDQLYRLLKDRFPHAGISVSTFPIAYQELLSALPHFREHAVVVDIGGGVTECSFFNEGILEEVVTIPQGVERWLTQIANRKGVSPEEVISWTSESGRFDALLAEYLAEWSTLLRPLIAAKILRQPARHFFLVGGGALLPQTSTSFAALLNTFPFGNQADTHTLSVTTFRDRFGQWPSSLLSVLDISLLALALLPSYELSS